jgi:hypothetical protein
MFDGGDEVNTLEFKHTLNNKLFVMQSLVRNLQESLPLLIATYATTPAQARAGDVPGYVLDALPKMVEHSLAAIHHVQAALRDLEESHHG